MGISHQAPDLETFDRRMAARLKAMRTEQGWTLDTLAGRCGVSRATLSRLENAEVSPTTLVLARLCAAYGMALSRLMHMVEGDFAPLVVREEQPLCSDPDIAFERRSVSPPAPTLSGEVQECRLGPSARIDRDAATDRGEEHHLLLVFGRLSVTVNGATHALTPGDCLRYRPSGPSALETPADAAARFYLFMV